MSNQTGYGSVVANEIMTLLRANREMLGLTDKYNKPDIMDGVFFGPQEELPFMPIVYLDIPSTDIEYATTTYRFQHDFYIPIITCDSDYSKADSAVQFESLKRAEKISQLLFDNQKLNGRVIQSYVAGVEPAVTQKNKESNMYFGHAVHWVGMSRVVR